MNNSSSSQPSVAVVILCWNGRQFLATFLQTVINNTPDSCRIVVADNDSSDDSVEYVRSHHPSVDVIEIPVNEGFAQGYNMALNQIEADYYVLLNQDVETPEGWLQPLIDTMMSDGSIAACQPKIKAYQHKSHFEYAGAAGGLIDTFGFTYCRGRLFDQIEEDRGQYDEPAEIFWASGACMMIRADLYHQMGGLDPLFFAHMEEIDLCWRLKNGGYRIMVNPQAEVYHVGGGSLAQGNPKKTYLNFRNNLFLLYKNLPYPKLHIRLNQRLIFDFVAAAQALMKGQWGDVKAIFSAHSDFSSHKYTLKRKRKVAWLNVREVGQGASPNLTGMYNGSIVWEHFGPGRNRQHSNHT